MNSVQERQVHNGATYPRARFEASYSADWRYVRSIARRAGIRQADLDDVAQDVFCVLLGKISDIEDRDSLRPWLATVARLVSNNRHRSERRMANWLDSNRQLDLDRDPSISRGIEPIATHEQRHSLTCALSRLDATRRAVLLLTAFAQCTAREIGELHGISPNTISGQLRSARQHMAALLNDG